MPKHGRGVCTNPCDRLEDRWTMGNPHLMERWAIRKRLRQMHRLLLDSRAALENASGVVRNKWLQDLLFMLACRRVIMLNLLDRELGTFLVSAQAAPEASHHFDPYLPDARGIEEKPNSSFMRACIEEESYLMNELHELMFQPGLSGRTRQMIVNVLSEAEENMNDLRFLRGNLADMRA